jgi:hypothetical protein
MISRIFELAPLLFLLAFSVGAFVLSLCVGLLKMREPAGQAALRGMESALLAFFGGLMARAFISILMGAANNSPGAGLAVGWGFFLWPGAVDTIAKIFGSGPVLTTPAALMWVASGVGAFTGMTDGLWQTHRWRGPGAITFLAERPTAVCFTCLILPGRRTPVNREAARIVMRAAFGSCPAMP